MQLPFNAYKKCADQTANMSGKRQARKAKESTKGGGKGDIYYIMVKKARLSNLLCTTTYHLDLLQVDLS